MEIELQSEAEEDSPKLRGRGTRSGSRGDRGGRNSRNRGRSQPSPDTQEEEEDHDGNDEEEEEYEEKRTSRTRSAASKGMNKSAARATADKGKGRSNHHRRRVIEEEEDSEGEKMDDGADDDGEDPHAHAEEHERMATESQGFFSSQIDLTQDIFDVKDHELKNFVNLNRDKQEKVVCDLFRVVFFKAHQFDTIDRNKCLKEAGISAYKISTAAFKEVEMYMKNFFGYELKRVPKWFEKIKNVPARVKDQYYVCNIVHDETGSHSQALHAVHSECMIEKGLLMVILGLAYCKGRPKHDGSRWILDKDLYYYLNTLDENVPSEPPSSGGRKKRIVHSQRIGTSAVSQTPDVDMLLDKFVKREYLLRTTASDEDVKADAKVENESLFYSMGPRAAIEVGRKQVIYFCAEILGTEPDPAMLQEIELDGDEDVDADT